MRRAGSIQAFSGCVMRFPSIPAALPSWVQRFTFAGLFLIGSVAFAGNESPMVSRSVRINGVKTSYALPRGATSFVIRLTRPAQNRSFIFVNENAAAEGELLIAVSDQSLMADSPKWNRVKGTIRFRRKRLFTVSLVGIEANYLRLSFRVEGPKGNMRTHLSMDQPRSKHPVTGSLPPC